MGLLPRMHSPGEAGPAGRFQRRRAGGRQTHGKSRSFSDRPGDADQNHREARPHTRQNGSNQQHKTRRVLTRTRGGGCCARGTRTGSAEGPRKCKTECRTVEELKYWCLPPKRETLLPEDAAGLSAAAPSTVADTWRPPPRPRKEGLRPGKGLGVTERNPAMVTARSAARALCPVKRVRRRETNT